MSIDQLRQRFIMYLDQTYAAPRDRSRMVVSGALALLGVFILLLCAALGVWQAAGLGVILTAAGGYRLYYALKPRRLYRGMRRVAERGLPVTAYLVQANSALYVPGYRNAYALVVFSFDPRGGEPRFMAPIARRLQDLKETTPSDPEVAAVARRITAEKAEFHHREKLPYALTGGADVYMGDILIAPTRLKERYLDRPSLVCLAEPGDSGGIEQVPDWLLEEARGVPAPSADQRSPVSRN